MYEEHLVFKLKYVRIHWHSPDSDVTRIFLTLQQFFPIALNHELSVQTNVSSKWGQEIKVTEGGGSLDGEI